MVQSTLFNNDPKKDVPFVPSLVKSAYQKRVRRGETEQALRLAKSAIHLDAHDFARRVMVVAPEESWVHPLLPEVAKIITRLQRKTETATDEDKSILLTIVRDVSEAPTRDFYIKNPHSVPFEPQQLDYLSPQERELVNSLIYRSQIGGMRSDITMFQNLINVWVNRFSNKLMTYDDLRSKFPTIDSPPVQWDNIEFASGEDIPYYAVDFHCFPPSADMILYRRRWVNGEKTREATDVKRYIDENLSGVVVKTRPGDTVEIELVKKTMWLHEASKNTKPNWWFDTPRTVDWYTDEAHYEPVEYREQLTELSNIMQPYWKDLAEWYVNKQVEAR